MSEETPEATQQVRVLPPFMVCHEGVRFLPDTVAEVPESVAQLWIRDRWVEVITDDANPKAGERKRVAQ